jgi:hypothetical protein
MQLFPHHILVAWDIYNAFNEYERAQVLALCQRDPDLHDMCRLFESEFRPQSNIYALVKGKLTLLGYRSIQGGQQGATTAVMGCNIVTLGPFSEVNDAVRENGGCARAIMDDLAVILETCGQRWRRWRRGCEKGPTWSEAQNRGQTWCSQ